MAGEAEDPKAILEELFRYLEEVRRIGLSREDFLRGKRVMYAEFVKSFDSTDSIANNLFSFLCEDSELLSYAEILDEVTFDDVCVLFEHSFDEEMISLSVIYPLK